MNPIVFTLDASSGFFSLLYRMLRVYLHAKKHRIPFSVNSKEWPYRFREGWHDYFTTLFEQNRSFLFGQIVVRLDREDKIPPLFEFFTAREYMLAIRNICQLKPASQQRICECIAEMGSNSVGLFVRRGDKLIEEASYISVSDILTRISYDEHTIFFIQSDDYTVIEEFKHCIPNKYITFVTPNQRGSYHRNLNIQMETANPYKNTIVSQVDKPKDQIYKETTDMLVGIFVCAFAPQGWTDTTSNVGRFIKLLNPETVKTYPEQIELKYNETIEPEQWLRRPT